MERGDEALGRGVRIWIQGGGGEGREARVKNIESATCYIYCVISIDCSFPKERRPFINNGCR